MTIKEARRLAGFTQKDAEEIFGIPVRTLQNYENMPEKVSPWIKEMLIREFLREAIDDAGCFGITKGDSPSDEMIRFHSRSDAERALANLTEGNVCYGKDREQELWSLWECLPDGTPVRMLSETRSKKRQRKVPEWQKAANEKRKQYRPSAKISKERAQRVCELFSEGKSHAEIVSLLKVSEKTIKKILERNGLALSTEIRRDVRARLKKGEKRQTISDALGISPEAVDAVFNRMKSR